VFNGLDTNAARRVCPRDLRLPKSNRLHWLEGDRKDQYSISVNMEYRICFRWTAAGPDQVEITDYH
jgi:toxin HigB-1